MKTLSQFRELLLDIRKNPGGHFRAPCYEKLCAFIRGIEYGTVRPLMEGFHAKITAAGGPSCLPWEFGLIFVAIEGSDGDIDVIIADPEADLHACRELLDRLVEHLDNRAASRRERGHDSRMLPGKSPARIRELLILLGKCTGMFVREPHYEKVYGFVRGVEWGSDIPLTAGLPEWIATRGGPPGLEWDYGFLHSVFIGDPDPMRTALMDEAADVRATGELLGWIIGRLDAGITSQGERSLAGKPCGQAVSAPRRPAAESTFLMSHSGPGDH